MKKVMCLVAVLVLIAGLCLTGRALYLRAKATLAGVLIRAAWNQSIQSGGVHKPWSWADTYPVARLEIPRLGYDQIVLEGATPRTLAFGPARLLSGPRVGAPGNLVFAGHRTSWFQPLEAVHKGDTIQVEWFDARRRQLCKRTYTVDLIRVVDPQDLTLLAPTPQDALTLITCYPFGNSPRSPQRYIVRAYPSGSVWASDDGRSAEKPMPGFAGRVGTLSLITYLNRFPNSRR